MDIAIDQPPSELNERQSGNTASQSGLNCFWRRNLNDLADLVATVSRIAGAEVMPLQIDFDLEFEVLRHLRGPRYVALDGVPPVRQLGTGSDRCELAWGLAEYLIPLPNLLAPAWRLTNRLTQGTTGPVEELWFVRTSDYRSAYKQFRKWSIVSEEATEPLLPIEQRRLLWTNTIDFLGKCQNIWDRFRIPMKRGVMLLGKPGNGKTMAARWIRAEALNAGYSWRTVRTEQYERARNEGEVAEFFSLGEPGIIFLDDFELGLKDRELGESTVHHSTLLTELDGISVPHGVVFLIASNLRANEVDPAIRRPGRMDVLLEFSAPSAAFRRKLLQDVWPKEISQTLSMETAIRETEGLSFADLDEIKKLMVLHWSESEVWNWDFALRQFQCRTDATPKRCVAGFASSYAPVTAVSRSA